MTDQEICIAATRGTTTAPKNLKLLARNDAQALIQWPGAYVGGAPFASWEPAWVELVNLKPGKFGSGLELVCQPVKPARITRAWLANIAAQYGLRVVARVR